MNASRASASHSTSIDLVRAAPASRARTARSALPRAAAARSTVTASSGGVGGRTPTRPSREHDALAEIAVATHDSSLGPRFGGAQPWPRDRRADPHDGRAALRPRSRTSVVGVGRADRARRTASCSCSGQLVGAAAGDPVERDARVEQKRPRVAQPVRVAGLEVSALHQHRHRAFPPAAVRGRAVHGRGECPADPPGRLHVAQPAAAVLQVGLEHLGDRARVACTRSSAAAASSSIEPRRAGAARAAAPGRRGRRPAPRRRRPAGRRAAR